MGSLLSRFFDFNERELGRLRPLVEKVNLLEPKIRRLSDSGLKKKTASFRQQLAEGGRPDEILPEAFAVVREASRRTTGMRPFDVQVMAGIALHQGKVVEQKTGEGKTLSATLALYLNSLSGKGSHLVTVNDYLARRDTEWMGPIFHLLGLTVGCLNHEKAYLYDPEGGGAKVTSGPEEVGDLPAEASAEAGTPEEMELGQGRFLREVPRRQAYQADITYGTNNEFGFDYLRDNMVFDLSFVVQINPAGGEGAHHFAIVDEVDSILIDEARTPLIISEPEEEATEKYYRFSKLVKQLTSGMDFEIDEKARAASLTEIGLRKIEKMLGVKNLYERDFETIRHIEQALRAQVLYHRDKDYIVKDGEVIIVDEFTGRLMFGRRYSEGLHQAIEAKEGVEIKRESKTLATISFQNYFRMYEKLAGMTGTAATEAEEFHKVYQLEVVVIPTNEPMIRTDHSDMVYKTQAGKFKAVVEEIVRCHKKGQPVLVGTTSIENNELLSKLLGRKRIPHEILNAKRHEKEAYILAKAGNKGAVTVATNMAGRGVDIKLEEGVVELGGLHVVGTERHEARRIDNQLRGRSGRQGDPGSSRFFVSLQDDLMRKFGGEAVENLMSRFGLEEDVPLESGLVTRAIENAQKRMEGYNFDIRKQLVEYDDVMNKHREIIYAMRRKILEGGEQMKEWLLPNLEPFSPKIGKIWEEREKELGEVWLLAAQQLTLQAFNLLWLEHISTMTDLRQSVALRGNNEEERLAIYKIDARQFFDRLVNEIWGTATDRLERVEIKRREDVPEAQRQRREVVLQHPTVAVGREREVGEVGTVERKGEKLGRNDPCWCGSGKKWKKCHYPERGPKV